MSTIRQITKQAIARTGRIWTGPAAGVRVTGFNDARTHLGLYEIELNRWIRQLALPGTPTFDVGAQFGVDTLLFAHLGASPVLAIEGEDSLAPTILENLRLNHLEGVVSVKTCWIGDGARDTVSIDTLAAQFFRPGFIKMDIEGAEADALRGATQTLEQCPRWLVETHGLKIENECIEMFVRHGFKIDIVNQRRWLREGRPIAHNRWLIATQPSQAATSGNSRIASNEHPS